MVHLDKARYDQLVKAVWRATIILSVVTIVEVSLALSHFYFFPETSKLPINFIMAILTLVKAFYIIGEFMHLRYEKKTFLLSLSLPLILLVWAIIACSVEGAFGFVFV